MNMTSHFTSSICVLVTVTLFYAASPRADVLDGGEIQFNGFVTDDAPKWTWQVATPEQSWAVDIADARAQGGQLVFDLREKGALPFLEGYLHTVAERAGPGFTPVISFSSAGQPFMVTAGDSVHAQHFRASVPVRDPRSGHDIGQLFFTLDQGMAVSAGRQEEGALLPAGMSLVNGQSVTKAFPSALPQGVTERLSALLLMNRGFGDGMSAAKNGQVVSQGVLADGRVMNLAAAYASAVSDFELRLPAEGTPSQWQAGLSVTVTVQ